jgi:hypothetical protein
VTEQALRIPLAQIEEHRDFRLRLEYEHIDELAQSFVETAEAEWKAGRTSSNGQQQPGRAILSEGRDRWELYSGLRRRLAMQKAYEATKDPRFSYYWLCDDTGIPREEMLRRALEDRSGIRENLTALEEVRVFRLFRDVDFRKVAADGEQRERYGRLGRVAEVLSDEALANLHRIEANAGSYVFRLPALEFLSGVPEGTDLYMTAAEIAVNRYDQSKKKMEDAYTFRKEVLGLQWFAGLFPPAAEATETQGSGETATQEGGAGPGQGDGGGAGEADANTPSSGKDGEQKQQSDVNVPTAGRKKSNKGKGAKPAAGGGSQPASLLRLEEGVLALICPFCGGAAPFKPESIQFDGYRLSLEGKPSTPVAAEAVTGEFADVCELCGKRFFYQVRLAEGHYYSRTGKTGEGEAAFAGTRAALETVKWDEAGDHWSVIDGDGKVVRDLPVVSGKEPSQHKPRRNKKERPGKEGTKKQKGRRRRKK